MENEKKYEGTVNITSAEYRELVTDAVTAKAELSEVRSAKWKLESERDKLQTECEGLRKRLDEALKKLNDCENLLNLHTGAYGYLKNPCTTTTLNGGINHG